MALIRLGAFRVADHSRRQSILSSRRAILAGACALLPASRGRAERPTGDAPAAPATPAVPDKVNLMFCGDSLAQGLYLTLYPLLRRRDTLRVVNGTQHATGLTRSDEHDWPAVARDLVGRHRPNLVVFWIGANDFRPLVLRETRSRFQFGTPAFAEHYARRAGEMVAAATAANARSIWLGLPNMRDAQFANAARTLNEIQEAGSTAAGAVFIPTWETTSDPQGRYLPAVVQERGPRQMRAEDGVHFTDFGYRRVAGLVFEAVSSRFPELALGLGPGIET
jgi:hypothetical protein